jgi:hypothetical protein
MEVLICGGAETKMSSWEANILLLEVTGAHFIVGEKLEVGSQLSLRLFLWVSWGI